MRVDDEIEIKAYYAGHVLGAAMFHIKVGNQVIGLLKIDPKKSRCEISRSSWETLEEIQSLLYFRANTG